MYLATLSDVISEDTLANIVRTNVKITEATTKVPLCYLSLSIFNAISLEVLSEEYGDEADNFLKNSSYVLASLAIDILTKRAIRKGIAIC